ncbi:MAG: SIR2 family protein [Oscillospiraceae bacterium]|nr:SIR2 family protein [Oscillospiraceae bacterium]
MKRQVSFVYPMKGPGRPQILLIGNGLEYKSGQRSWEQLVRDLTLPEKREMSGVESLPFPLRYELLSTPSTSPTPMGHEDILQEEKRLAQAMKAMVHRSNPLLEKLPGLRMDHIFTTNYSYCLEQAFFPHRNFGCSRTRSQFRFDLRDRESKAIQTREVQYRLYTGYFFPAGPDTPQGTGLWHIHGESSVPQGIILGHDRYGRLLARIVQCCQNTAQRTSRTNVGKLPFLSWPSLFLFGDVYILGFGFDSCEFDLWWLLRRKQRERNGDGKVYFYDKPPFNTQKKMHHFLLQANGAEVRTAGATDWTDYDTFYAAAIQDIRQTVEQRRT